MLVLQKKKHGISLFTIWYAKKPVMKSGIIQYREATFQPKGEMQKFDTLISDLTESEEEIVARFSKNCRYEVRRAEKENVKADIRIGSSLTQKEIDEFCDFFVEFWASKGVEYKSVDSLKSELAQYAAQNAFAITCASIGGKKIVYHTYVIDDVSVRLFHSASLYREDNEVPQKIVGMANRFLHKADMMYFKTAGKKQYDWGGAGTTEEVIHITEFKKSFGGTPHTFYNGQEIRGILPQLAYWYLKWRSQ